MCASGARFRADAVARRVVRKVRWVRRAHRVRLVRRVRVDAEDDREQPVRKDLRGEWEHKGWRAPRARRGRRAQLARRVRQEPRVYVGVAVHRGQPGRRA